MRLLSEHVVGKQTTELVHIGLIAMMSNSGTELLNRTCFIIRLWASASNAKGAEPVRANGITELSGSSAPPEACIHLV
jgi:hypothetical protein